MKPREARRRDELAFLPAALEIVETPPSPVGRAISMAIMACILGAVAWASVGTVDIVATARGTIIPNGHTKLVQPFEGGVVRAIHVKEGQAVSAGDLLIELDPIINQADLDRLKGDLTTARLDVARLRAALATAHPEAAFQPPDDAPMRLVAMHRGLLATQVAEQDAKLAAIDSQRVQKEAELKTVAAMLAKLDATIPLMETRVEVRKHLADRELGSRLQYLAELQDLTGYQQDVRVLQSRIHEAEAAVASLRETRARAVAEFRRSLFEDLAKVEQRVAGLEQEVVKAGQKASLQRLTAPVDGVVNQLAVHSIGGVVTPAQILLAVVPADGALEIEAAIANRDIGFVHPGQPAEIKVDAFNFTRYGLVSGKVVSLSGDAVQHDASPRPRARGEGTELEYVARISFDRRDMKVEDGRARLTPGMTATVDIETGRRSVISYLLSPLQRYRQESFRER